MDAPLVDFQLRMKAWMASEEDGVGIADKLDELGEAVCGGGLPAEHTAGDAVSPLNISANGYFGIDGRLKGGQFAAIQPNAHAGHFIQSVHNGVEASGFSIEGHKGDIREPWLGVIHRLSRPLPGEPLTRKTAVTVDKLGATIRYGDS